MWFTQVLSDQLKIIRKKSLKIIANKTRNSTASVVHVTVFLGMTNYIMYKLVERVN